MVEGGRFRADLYDRLNILSLETVPLRYQKEKIKDLIVRGLERECAAVGRNRPFEISNEAVCALENYDWFGNFRELKNFATRLAVECFDAAVISLDSVRWVLGERINCPIATEDEQTPQFFTEKTADYFQKDDFVMVAFDAKTDDLKNIYIKAAGSVISHVLDETDGNLRRAASKMGTTHSTLSRIMKKYNSLGEPQNFTVSGEATRTFAAVA